MVRHASSDMLGTREWWNIAVDILVDADMQSVVL